jgi:signal transduction histidine kinase
LSIDPLLTLASFGIGIVVGLTGMGGGALMTPVLVLFFHVPPLAAVSSDLVASAIMKPVGSFVHLRRGTVHLGLVKWLCVGSIPGAFSGVLIARALGQGQEVQEVVRIALGVALLVAGVATFVALSDAAEAVGKGLVAALIVVAGLALIFLPWVRRLASELAEERRERIRSQERAELAAHLHDSVLQTLALIQRRSDSPETVVRLARRQERELRSWLSGPPRSSADRSLVAAVRRAAEEVEDLHGVPIEVVVVGDCTLDESLDALVAAAREAMSNAARLSGADGVAVYLEVADDRVTLYVRDRGVGFDPEAVPPDRKGVSESIVGRMRRHGGLATIHTAPGAGTEVELELPRSDAAAGSVAGELSRT